MGMNNVNTELPKAELIKLLRSIEPALEEKWQYADRVVRLESDGKDYLREPEEYEKDWKKILKIVYIAPIVIAVLTVLFTYISTTDGLLLPFLCSILSFLGRFILVVSIFLAIFMTVVSKHNIKKYKEEHSKLLAALDEANKQLEECGKRCDEAIGLIQYFCPKECYDPRNLRKYISFFEDGRADTIKEARNLFDEYMHRERMEQKADAQYAATQEAIAAAYAARVAADSAATTASQAKASADWAAYNSRFKK